MQPGQPAKLLRIHISEADRWKGKPLYEAIVDQCRKLNIAGATVFRGLEGYGETAEMHAGGLMGGDQPIVITIVDTSEQLALLMPKVEAMMETGVMAISSVKALRVSKNG
jgi:PII-like signaling protein